VFFILGVHVIVGAGHFKLRSRYPTRRARGGGKSERMPRRNWIQGAIRHPGRFDAYCHRQHMAGATGACIRKGKHSRNATTRREANLAQTLRGLRRHT